jgi:hypothetical protein
MGSGRCELVVCVRTLANLSRRPEQKVGKLQLALKGLPAARDLAEAFEITHSLPHGHVAAVLGSARRLGLEEKARRIRPPQKGGTSGRGLTRLGRRCVRRSPPLVRAACSSGCCPERMDALQLI